MPDDRNMEKPLSSTAEFVGRVVRIRDCLSPEFDCTPVVPSHIVTAIRSRDSISDAVFDQYLPPRYRLPSPLHWSSVAVAREVASMIGALEPKRFIDIGSGVGKLCILLNFLTEHEIFGIEQRKDLHDVGQRIVEVNGLKKVTLVHGNMLDLHWDDFDIFYLYNPFYEHVCKTELARIDGNIELHKSFFARYTSEVFRQLTWGRRGQRLITFHGYGGSIPKGWRLTQSRVIGDGNLSLWEKE
jgi:hypothetical protein